MLGAKKCCCGAKCGTSTSSGGAGVTENKYIMPKEAGMVEFTYNAYRIEDRFTIFDTDSPDRVFFDTGERVSGKKTIKFWKPTGVTSVTVRVEGPSGTAWTYTIGCPEQDNTCLFHEKEDPEDTTTPDCKNPIETITVTLSAEGDYIQGLNNPVGYKIREVRWGNYVDSRYHTSGPDNEPHEGDFKDWDTVPLNVPWPEKPYARSPAWSDLYFSNLQTGECERYNVYYYGDEEKQFSCTGETKVPLSIFNGTFELTRSEDDPRLWTYEFDNEFPTCGKFPSIDETSCVGNPVRILYNEDNCALRIENIKMYTSIGEEPEEAEDCGDIDIQPKPVDFKYKIWSDTSIVFPRIVCNYASGWTPVELLDDKDVLEAYEANPDGVAPNGQGWSSFAYPRQQSVPINTDLGNSTPESILLTPRLLLTPPERYNPNATELFIGSKATYTTTDYMAQPNKTEYWETDNQPSLNRLINYVNNYDGDALGGTIYRIPPATDGTGEPYRWNYFSGSGVLEPCDACVKWDDAKEIPDWEGNYGDRNRAIWDQHIPFFWGSFGASKALFAWPLNSDIRWNYNAAYLNWASEYGLTDWTGTQKITAITAAAHPVYDSFYWYFEETAQRQDGVCGAEYVVRKTEKVPGPSDDDSWKYFFKQEGDPRIFLKRVDVTFLDSETE